MRTSENYNKAFNKYLHGKALPSEYEDLKEGSDSAGYIMPRGFAGDYDEALVKENLFRRYGTVLKTEVSGFARAIHSTATAKIVAENESYPEDDDTFTALPFKSYKLAALSKLGSELIFDNNFDVYAYLKSEFAKRFGRAEEDIFLNGTGENEPAGLLSSAETVSVGLHDGDVGFDDIIKLYFALKPEYRRSAVWIMNDATALKLRMLKDSGGGYLWNSSDNTILGKPVVISQFMPDAETGGKPVAFADLSFYWILERQPLYVKRLNELFSSKHIVGIAANERIDGMLIRPEAAKVMLIE